MPVVSREIYAVNAVATMYDACFSFSLGFVHICALRA